MNKWLLVVGLCFGTSAPVCSAHAALNVGAERPQDIVIRYYEAIGQRDYAAAYALWSGSGQASGKTLAQFGAGFANTASTFVRVTGPVRLEGAAGSVYAIVPVEVRAQLKSGERQRFSGSYVLRRNNTGTGSAESQRWHIYKGFLQLSE